MIAAMQTIGGVEFSECDGEQMNFKLNFPAFDRQYDFCVSLENDVITAAEVGSARRKVGSVTDNARPTAALALRCRV